MWTACAAAIPLHIQKLKWTETKLHKNSEELVHSFAIHQLCGDANFLYDRSCITTDYLEMALLQVVSAKCSEHESTSQDIQFTSATHSERYTHEPMLITLFAFFCHLKAPIK